ncbi:MAG: exodeoxyribonuclease VII large subunit, partial [Gaiella sp.]
MSAAEPAERTVYPVEAFNARLRGYLQRVRGVWVEGEIGALRRNEAWATVFPTLKGATGATLSVQMRRTRFDALPTAPVEGVRVRVCGDLDLWEARGELVFRATALEAVGAGDLLAQLEERKQRLAAEGLFAEERKRPLPRVPRVVGLLTGADAAARGDVVAALDARFPAVTLVVAETRVQGASAATRIVAALARLAARGDVDVIVLARGGGSLEDLLPFSDERVVRGVAACPVPVVSAVGHEQDTPLCDLAADARAATPTAAVRLIVPDLGELRSGLDASRSRLTASLHGRLRRRRELVVSRRGRATAALRHRLARERDALAHRGARLRHAPPRVLERRRATLDAQGARLQALAPHATLARGYAIVRVDGHALRDATTTAPGERVAIELAVGALGARVEE